MKPNYKAIIAFIAAGLAMLWGISIFIFHDSASIALSVILLGIIFLFLAVFLQKNKKAKPDYRILFILGITWIPLGIATKNNAFTIIGIIFMILGLVNKKKWKKRKNWSEMSKPERNIKIAVLIALGILVLVGLMFFLLLN